MKRFLTLVLVLGMVAMLLAGCATPTDQPAPEPTKEATDTAANEGAQEEAAEVVEQENPTVIGIELTNLGLDGTLVSKYEGQTINIATAEGDFAKALKHQAEYFQAISGATVVVNTFPGESFMEKIQLDLNAGGAFDIVLMPIANIHGYATTNLVMDMAPMLDEYASESYDVDDFLTGLFDTYARYDGKIVALPYKPDVIMNFYRTDLFEDEGIKAQFKEMYGRDLTVPKDTDEFLEVAKFFTKAHNPDSPTTYGYCANAGTGNLRWIWQNRLCAFGGDVVTANNEAAFNNEAGVKAMEYMLELATCAPANWQEFDWGSSNAMFASGEAAMMEQWPGLYNTTQAEGSAVVGKVGASVTAGGAPVLGGWALAISAKTTNPELAFKFCEFTTSKDGEILKMEDTMDPCRTSNFEREEVMQFNPLYTALLESLSLGASIADVDVPIVTKELNDVLELGGQAVLNGEKTPQEALAWMESQFDKIISDAGLK